MANVINSDRLKLLGRWRRFAPLDNSWRCHAGSNTRQKSSIRQKSSVKLSMSASRFRLDLFPKTASYAKKERSLALLLSRTQVIC
jgi:hypothetical protein